MKSAIAKKWVAALRSGKYEQGEGNLKDEFGAYCCLGVLQECVLGIPINLKADYLSRQAQMAAGMRGPSGHPVTGAIPAEIEIGGIDFLNLARANDYGVPFSAIADWIEDNHASL